MTHTHPSRLVPFLLAALAACEGAEPMQPHPSDGPVPASLTLSSASVQFASIGDTHSLAATVRDQYGDVMAAAPVAWTSSAHSVASVGSTGVVTALANGASTITATAGAVAGTASISVAQIAASVAVAPDSLDLAGPGDTVTVGATLHDAGGTPLSEADLTWSSADPSIATVDLDGHVTGVQAGTTDLTVSSQGLPATRLPVVVGAGVLAGPIGGEVTLADGAITLDIPPGALDESVFLTAEPATGLPTPAPIAGTAYDLGPNGLTFAQAVTKTIEYHLANVPVGVLEEDLRVYELVGAEWIPVPAGSVDAQANRVSAQIHGFSLYAVLHRLQVTTSSLPPGVTQSAYSQALTASGGDGSHTWSLEAGTLPPGLVLGPEGLVAGVPTTSGSFTFTVRATSGTALSVTHELGIDIAQTAPPPTVTLSASPSSITSGASSTLTWTSTDATTCTASIGWSGSRAPSGSETVSPVATTTYTLTCDGPQGSASSTVHLAVDAPPAAPTVSLSASPTSIESGQASTLTWSSADATVCAASDGWSGAKALGGSQAVSPGATTIYTLTCDGDGGSAVESVTVTVNAPPPVPTVSLSASPTSIESGQASTLTWSSADATVCTASDGWSGAKALGGSQAVSPGATTTYTLTCDGAGGSAVESATVTVSAPPPVPSGLVAHWSFEEGSGGTAFDGAGSNDGVLGGGPTWSTGRIDGGLLFDGIDDRVEVPDDGSLDATGDLTVAAWIKPSSLGENQQGRIVDKASADGTSGYVLRLDASNRIGFQQHGSTAGVTSTGGVVTLNVWQHVVAVVTGGTGVALYVDGASVGGGTLSSPVAANSKPLRIGGRHDGSRMFDGSIDELRVYGGALSAGEVAALYAEEAAVPPPPQPPTVTLTASPPSISSGASSTLTWSSTDATACSASDGWSGARATSGSEAVSPTVTTSFTLTCSGAGGSAEKTASVTVGPPYFPPSEAAGGWRSLVAINATPSASAKANIAAVTGVDWDRLEEAYDYSEISAPSGNVLVIRNGWIVGEWGSTASERVASVTKSLTGLAMARLMDMSDGGQLGQSIGLQSLAHAYLPAAFGASDPLKQQIRIEHLMTMSPGIQPADPDDLGESERLAYPMDAAPGQEWVYSSLPANLLSMILEGVSGQSLGDFFNAQVAAPIGVAPLAWQTIDGGYTKGGAGAESTARDLARVAYLALRDGAWDDGSGPTQVVSANRVATLTSPAAVTAGITFRASPGSPFPLPSDAPNHYGHLWWTNATQVALGPSVPADAYYMHGCRDDLVVVVPSEDLVVVRISESGPVCTDEAFRSTFMQLVMAALTG